MKRLLAVALFALCAVAHATGPEYWSSRSWVIERCSTNQVRPRERVFIATTPGSGPPAFATIVRYRKTLSIREVIDQTRFRDNAAVTVLRSGRPATPVFDTVVRADECPTFALKALDMVWVGELLPR
jgi:hypothetical protein